MKQYKIAAIGCGKIWEIGHWPGLEAMPDEATVRYVYDLDAELSAKAAAVSGAEVIEKPEVAFEDPSIDIVAIMTPPFARTQYVKAACESGKHLMLEKPMARTLSQATEIVRDVRKAGVKCLIPFARVVHAAYREIADMIRGGAFGEPLAFVHTNLGAPYSWVPLDHWMHDEQRSGGPLFDYSIHFMELARACLDSEAEQVFYDGAILTDRVKSDDQATINIRYAKGRYGQFTKSWAFPPGCGYGHSADHVICRDAVVEIGKSITVHRDGESRELVLGDESQNGRSESYRNLIDAIDNGTPLHADETTGLRIAETLDAMERSKASGKREEVAIHEGI